MEFNVIVVDRYGNQLSDEELDNKVIDSQQYYDIVLPIRKRINDELFGQGKKSGFNSSERKNHGKKIDLYQPE